MKYIVKQKEPSSLTAYRSTPNSTYGGCNTDDIRKALIAEQGAICAYCMQRISNKRRAIPHKPKTSKPLTEIEHYRSQDVFNGKNGKPDLRLNYNNMLGVCNGNAGQPKLKQHCDKSKDFETNKKYLPLTIDPLNSNCEQVIEYKGNGKIFSKNERINRDLDIVLNLNERNLALSRSAAVQLAIENINRKGKKEGWSFANINAELRKWENLNNNAYRPFCQAVISYLQAKLKK